MPLRQKPHSRRNQINTLNRLTAMAEPVAFKYRAFISYSHADTSSAKWLHRALEGFTIDKDLVGRETATGAIPKALQADLPRPRRLHRRPHPLRAELSPRSTRQEGGMKSSGAF